MTRQLIIKFEKLPNADINLTCFIYHLLSFDIVFLILRLTLLFHQKIQKLFHFLLKIVNLS